METRCYFNQVDLEKEEVDFDAPYIDLDVDIAENICEKLLDSGIIDSYIIPAFFSKKIKFNKSERIPI